MLLKMDTVQRMRERVVLMGDRVDYVSCPRRVEQD